MAADRDFVDYVLDCMSGLNGDLGPVQAVRFFGGTGLRLDGAQFAFVSRSNRVFFVVDDATRPRYEAAGMEPFSYTRGSGLRLVPRWYELPEDVLMDRDELRLWVRDAAAIAYRTKKPKAKAGSDARAAPSSPKVAGKNKKPARPARKAAAKTGAKQAGKPAARSKPRAVAKTAARRVQPRRLPSR